MDHKNRISLKPLVPGQAVTVANCRAVHHIVKRAGRNALGSSVYQVRNSETGQQFRQTRRMLGVWVHVGFRNAGSYDAAGACPHNMTAEDLSQLIAHDTK